MPLLVQFQVLANFADISDCQITGTVRSRFGQLGGLHGLLEIARRGVGRGQGVENVRSLAVGQHRGTVGEADGFLWVADVLVRVRGSATTHPH